ncbi:MAG TPA: copper amine oxidase N-terminal domain-containing protein [Ruminiclostridium sp.]|nr:copper amine oxidase N-terminal domain-containing protein [Ruminiclostridium sp.]
MKKIQKVLIGSMALALVMTSTVMPGVMAKSSHSSGAHQTSKSDRVKGNSNAGQTDWKAQKKQEKEAEKEQKKQEKEAEKAAIKATYSADELSTLNAAGDRIKKNNKDITVLPVENIIVKGAKVKFDTPPVIKSGRTLIPVKAISEAFGASVKWIAAERKVVITKGTTEIVLQLDNNKIYVNGVESTIDVPACSINGRTVVPLKFIVEKLGLLVNWDNDSQTVEIGTPDPTTPPTTTTGSAIGVTSGSAIDVQPAQ